MRKFFDNVTQWLVGLGTEFYLHILCVMFVATIVARVCNVLGAERFLAACIGAFAGMAAGFIKEAVDVKTTGVVEERDYVADLIGAVLFMAIYI